jgi:hypothetical protein
MVGLPLVNLSIKFTIGEEKMKKLALSAILGASLMISSSAFALTSMSADSMKSATGQAGVSIAIDNVVIEQYAASTTYTDTDGAKYGDTAGAIEISAKHSIKTFLAMTSASDYKADFDAATGTTLGDMANWKKASALSIDVGNCSALAAGLVDNMKNTLTALAANAVLTPAQKAAALVANGLADDAAEAADLLALDAAGIAAYTTTVAGVVIGLPTLLIKTTGDTYTVGVVKANAFNDGDKYIQVTKGNSTMAILGGTVEIAAH